MKMIIIFIRTIINIMDMVIKIIGVIHKTAGVLWLGEVFVINFIIIPSMMKMKREEARKFARVVFPKAFNLASFLSLTTVITGVALFLMITKGSIDVLSGKWGTNILIGGVIGLALTLFHFSAEPKLKRFIEGEDEKFDRFLKVIRIVPRIGMAVIFLIYMFMLNATRDIF